jgi:hypothetical protein
MERKTLMPLFVIPRLMIGAVVWEKASCDDDDFLIRFDDPSSVNQSLFNMYLMKEGLFQVNTTRKSLHLRQAPTVVLCDNCLPHCDEETRLFFCGTM